MALEAEGCTAIVYYAAWAISENDPARAAAVSMAKAWCGDCYKHVAGQGIQLHGGIGFTWDHDMHLYYKRAMSSDAAFGDATYHRGLLAKQMDALPRG
jgi:alkylation response protein AidB-like acyl-CoA dehydrogenase